MIEVTVKSQEGAKVLGIFGCPEAPVKGDGVRTYDGLQLVVDRVWERDGTLTLYTKPAGLDYEGGS